MRLRVELGVLCVLIGVALVPNVDSPVQDNSAIIALPMDEEQMAMQAEIDRIQESILAKDAVVADLIAGRLTLRQAAARFEELDTSMPEWPRACWRQACPGNTDEERYCWTVLRFLPSIQDPERRRILHERLKAELPDHLRKLLDRNDCDKP